MLLLALAWQSRLKIKPILEIRPGYQFTVIVTKDLVFQKPYAAGRQEIRRVARTSAKLFP
jgi:hypothetical protein